jgi:hypothetical protein
MATNKNILNTKLLQAISGAMGAFGVLTSIFIVAMVRHYGKIDWEYLLWAETRIFAISLVVALMLYLIKRIQLIWAVVLGSVVGFMIGVGYVMVNINA